MLGRDGEEMSGTTFNGTAKPRLTFQECWNEASERAKAEAEQMIPGGSPESIAECARSLTLGHYRQVLGERRGE